jgi:uncharacterized membrane protein YccC
MALFLEATKQVVSAYTIGTLIGLALGLPVRLVLPDPPVIATWPE